MLTACWFTYIGPGRVGVSRSVPRNIRAGYRRYQPLNPGVYFNKVSEAEYRRLYAEQLACLDPRLVWVELTAMAHPYEPVLMCWERAGVFCHRRLVADWFQGCLGVVVPEADPKAAITVPHPPVQLSFL